MSDKREPPDPPESGQSGEESQPGSAEEADYWDRTVKALEDEEAELDKKVADPESEVVDQRQRRALKSAQIAREKAAEESLRTGSLNRRRRIDKEIENERELAQARIENENRLTEARIDDLRKRRLVQADDRRKHTQATINIRERQSKTTHNVRERDSRTTQVERYVWMVVVIAGMFASIVLAFATAGNSAWEYRTFPFAGLAMIGTGGVRLWSLSRPHRRGLH